MNWPITVLLIIIAAIYIIYTISTVIRAAGKPPRDQRRRYRPFAWITAGVMLPIPLWEAWSLV